LTLAKWRVARPGEGIDVECLAGSECEFPQRDGRPGIAYGYWIIDSIPIRACSRKCAEKIFSRVRDRVGPVTTRQF
jgi:hypothetical protein